MPLDKQLRGNIISDNNGALEVGFLEEHLDVAFVG